MQKEWEASHTVTEEIAEGPPSRRANATFTACPSGNYLWCIGGEFFGEDGKARFYNDVFRYSPEKDEWRKFVSQTCPGPRSAHAAVASPAGGGKIFVFGGEFSSLHQTTFHHYRDFWCFDVQNHTWDRIETKTKPSARSGHRLAIWKHFIVLFGGFYDPGITTRYLNDLWIFDTQEYKWNQIEFRETDPKPSPRSGFSFLPTTNGVLLHGGYCKEYAKGKRSVGVMLEDTWFLHLSIPTEQTSTAPTLNASTKRSSKTSAGPSSKNIGVTAKWERRRKLPYAPSARSGCTMALWHTRNMGILFGGVTDEDTSEETLESVFWNELYGYQIDGKGKWLSLTLRRPKKPSTKSRKSKENESAKRQTARPLSSDEEEEGDDEAPLNAADSQYSKTTPTSYTVSKAQDPDDPNATIPLPRYNSMLAVLRNTLFIYGGIFERGSREYTLDDFYSLHLDKLEKYICLKETAINLPDDSDESSSDEDDDETGSENGEDDDGPKGGDGTDGDEIGEDNKQAPVNTGSDPESQENRVKDSIDATGTPAIAENKNDDLRGRATAFMGVSKDVTRSPEDVISTPLPGETLATFYARSREYWSQKALSVSDNRGKDLRRDGFSLAQERYASYRPILQEVEKILVEAGLDEDEMKRSSAARTGSGGVKENRNRR